MNEGTFTSEIDVADLESIGPVCAKFGVDPVSSSDAEAFFSALIVSSRATGEPLLAAIERALAADFRYLTERPMWIQGPDWQFDAGRPMHFVGQLNCDASSRALHDDASFYVFWSPTSGITKTIVQIA